MQEVKKTKKRSKLKRWTRKKRLTHLPSLAKMLDQIPSEQSTTGAKRSVRRKTSTVKRCCGHVRGIWLFVEISAIKSNLFWLDCWTTTFSSWAKPWQTCCAYCHFCWTFVLLLILKGGWLWSIVSKWKRNSKNVFVQLVGPPTRLFGNLRVW